VQIEYALNAVAKGFTSLGIKASNGVVLATEKKSPTSLMDSSTIEKISLLADHIGVVYSGMGPDSRLLVRKGRKAAQEYFRKYHDPIPTETMVKELAAVMQEYTQSGGVRPFGVSLLVAGFNTEDGDPQLYQVDPSGSYFAWKASAIGKNFINARTFLEKRYVEDMDIEDAIHTAILTLKEGFEGEMTDENIEIGVCRDDGAFEVLSDAEIRDYLEAV